ncbi:MAG TPA: DNA polymerase III subunit delta' [Alphaproteobacteria bacterium]|nr:DNA polymerase III subunit delta' [Micavibrio sp.]HQX28010.1 DNA polymerase III subunit delta' [Alphaproteobacteria bacterium]
MDLFGDDIEEEIEDVEEAAEAAPPENTFSHPRTMSLMLGHAEIEKRLLETYNSGRMPHALVFAGPKGIGKATMAYRFARFLLKNGIHDPNQSSMFGDAPPAASLDVNPADPVARRLASGGHADFFSTEKKFDEDKGVYKDTLEVAEIRKIAPFLRMTSSEGGWRIVIADDADSMTRSAQNGILKILEEPPRNSLLILVAHRAGSLIPTIRSRARFINFLPLDNAAMKELIGKHSPNLSTKDTETIIRLSEGSFGKATQYIESGITDTLTTITQMLKQDTLQWVSVHKLADSLSGPGSDPSYNAFREILDWTLRQATRARARGEAPPVPLQDFLKNSSLEELLKICENLEDHFGRSDAANLDRRQTVLGAFSLLAA